ncbi:aminoglycoside phosphotransferase family protein [Micromonospora sp. NPDC047557]|uniref:aminoglycoside phosphotransferase family protein n=1 Tax=Micromonospora sp. NPDC047557 TaxID=3364250 RepID=UPI00371C4131
MTTIADERAPDWSSAQWQEQARSWVDEQLSRAGRRVTGPVEPRVRPWSLVWRVPTDGGPVWFKANNRGTTHEAVLIATLAGLAPERVLAPIGVDRERGWSLLPDGGESLRDVLGRDPDLAHWERALPGYAALQLATAPRADELVALGVPDHRPEVLPGLLADLLDDRESLRVGAEGGLAVSTYERLRAELPAYAQRCRRLADIGIPATVQHDDLHDGNVFAGPAGYRYFDWGDASVAHPFGTLLVTLRSIRYATALSADDASLARLRDGYLEAWTDRYDRHTLVEAADLAMNLGAVSRSLSWRRALDTADPARAEYAEAVPGWLAELFAATPLQPEH